MMEATPTASLVVAEAELLLEVLIVALNTPAQLGGVHQGRAADGGGQGGQPVFRRLGFVLGPFDQAPFLGARCCAMIIAMRRADTYGGEARGEVGVAAFPPGDPPPCL